MPLSVIAEYFETQLFGKLCHLKDKKISVKRL